MRLTPSRSLRRGSLSVVPVVGPLCTHPLCTRPLYVPSVRNPSVHAFSYVLCLYRAPTLYTPSLYVPSLYAPSLYAVCVQPLCTYLVVRAFRACVLCVRFVCVSPPCLSTYPLNAPPGREILERFWLLLYVGLIKACLNRDLVSCSGFSVLI